jgi:hypothetical protein
MQPRSSQMATLYIGQTLRWEELRAFGPRLDGSGAHSLVNRGPGGIGGLAIVGRSLWWTEFDDDATSFSVVTGSVDGATVGDPVVVQGTPSASATDESGTYVSDGAQILFVAPGSAQATILVPDQAAVTSIAVDATHIYWTRNVNCIANPNVGNGMPVCDGVLSWAPKGGGSVTTLTGSENARSVAVDDACVYWTTSMGQFHTSAPVGIRGAPKVLATPYLTDSCRSSRRRWSRGSRGQVVVAQRSSPGSDASTCGLRKSELWRLSSLF